MIRIIDALKLAYTKLRTRKLRLLISLLISSVLFGALMGGTLIVTGALKSLDDFSKEGFSNRYIIAGVNQTFQSGYDDDAALIARVEQMAKDETAAKKAAAKRLNIQFDAATNDTQNQAIYTDPTNGTKHLNIMSPLAQKAIAEHQKNQQIVTGLDKFKQQVGVADHFYTGVSKAPMRDQSPSLILMQDGKELYDVNGKNAAMSMGYGNDSGQTGLATMTNEWNLLDADLLKPFILKGQTLDIGADGSIPIVASYSAAQEVLKLPKLSNTATAAEKKNRLEEVRNRIAGQTFEVCYRNYTSNTDYQAAVQQQELIKQNIGKPGYVKPSLIYKPSTVACQAPVVERDVRTPEEKTYQSHQDQFDREFGKIDARSEILKFRIVGVTQDSPYSGGMVGGGAFGAMDILSTITTSSLGARWVSPMSARDVTAATKDVFAPAIVQVYGSQDAYFAEYSNATTARDVLKNKTCRMDYGGPVMQDDTAGLPTCSLTGKATYSLYPFGSASLAIDDFKRSFHTLQMWAALIVGGVATFILMGVIGRILADARKETAVFRATGATRLMIAQIYIVYTLYLVIIMILIAFGIGMAIALWVQSRYAADVSINMALLFNISDLSKPFTFYGLEPYDIGVISLAVLAAATAGAAVPIAANMRRNPIRDMRNE